MRRLDKKGMTMIEIILSIALISIVLIFLMSLFLKVRGTYNQSKIQSNYETLGANVIKAIGNDIENYGLYSVEYDTDSDANSAVIFTFNTFRPQHLSERIKKVLRVKFDENKYILSYMYESKFTTSITSTERVTGVLRELPSDVIVDSSKYIELTKHNLGVDTLVEIKVPMSNEKGTIYDINVYGLIKGNN